MSSQISSPVVDSSCKTRLKESLERAKAGQGPSIGQWMMFPGYSLTKTVATLGEDVSWRYRCIIRACEECIMLTAGTSGS